MNTLPLRSFTCTCSKIASFIKGKTTEEIRQRFHIQSDFTPEEEEKVGLRIEFHLDPTREQMGG